MPANLHGDVFMNTSSNHSTNATSPQGVKHSATVTSLCNRLVPGFAKVTNEVPNGPTGVPVTGPFDRIYASHFSDGQGADYLTGGSGSDTIIGGRGADLSVDLNDKIQDAERADGNFSTAFFGGFGGTPFINGGRFTSGLNDVLGGSSGSVFGGGSGSIFA